MNPLIPMYHSQRVIYENRKSNSFDYLNRTISEIDIWSISWFHLDMLHFIIICSIFTIINQIILLLVSRLFLSILLLFGYSTLWWFYLLTESMQYDKWIILSTSILISKFISNTSYQMRCDIDIDIDRILLTTIILEDSTIIILATILSIDFHQISKNRRNIYLFTHIHIHTNTIDWFGLDMLEWTRKINCLKIRNIYSWFNHSISN